MFDIKWIRDNPAAFDAGLRRRGLDPLSGALLKLDEERRALVTKLQDAQGKRNAASKEIGKAKAAKDEATAARLMEEVAAAKAVIAAGEDDERRLDKALTDQLSVIPNLPLAEVPDGADEKGNGKSLTANSSLSTLNSLPPPPGGGLGYCPACKTGHVVRGKTAFGCVRFREGCTFRVPIEVHGKKLSDPQAKALLAKGRTPVMKGFVGAEGQKFDAAIGLDTSFQPMLLQVADSKPGATPDSGQIPCPVCKLGTMLKGKAAYGCSRFREDCQFRVAFEWGGKQLTETQLKQLLRKGETSVIKGFLSAKTGKKYDAALKVEEGRVVPVFG